MSSDNDIDHWNIKLYEGPGDERETIRNLHKVAKDSLMQAFDRLGVQAQAMGYTADGEWAGEGESVNRPADQPTIWFPENYEQSADVKDPYDVAAHAPKGEDTLQDSDLRKLLDVFENVEIDSSANRRIIRAEIR